MNKKILIPTISFIAVLFFAIIILAKNSADKQRIKTTENKPNIKQEMNVQGKIIQDNTSQDEIILFYGDGCPHCANVEKFLEDNNVKDKIEFEQKEVYHNKQNANELRQKAQACGLSTASIGVPFLWYKGECRIGDQNIIEIFKQKINES